MKNINSRYIFENKVLDVLETLDYVLSLALVFIIFIIFS